ncbi:MoCF-biosynth domain-containing protein [Aphelenchoides bicaudatus]|nr:MoCF-biosynth domain-containing protein [Aphelenchoides bicaudatus]
MTSDLIRRPRQSPWQAVPMEEALEIVHANADNLQIIEVKLADLKTGDILAQDVKALHPHPRFRTSRMDGYAFKAADGQGSFLVLGGIGAGSSAKSLEILDRHCYRINTGGVVPDQADAVVPVEFTRLTKHDNQNELEIEIERSMTSGQNIREVGSDISTDQLLIPHGTELRPPEIGLLASCALGTICVFKRPKIGVLSTGDELIDPIEEASSSLKEGQIWDSNRPMLLELLRAKNFQTWNGGIVKDKRELLKNAIVDGFKECDALVLSGGVSMGDKDLLKGVLTEELHFQIRFGRVQMKPGLPSTFAVGRLHEKQCVVFGLPGNPVSAFVSAHLFVLPWLRRRAGYSAEASEGTVIKVRITSDYSLDSRPEYARAYLQFNNDGLPDAHLITTNQVSSRLISASHANLLLKLPPKSEQKQKVLKGEIIDAIIIDRV